jgi:uncharacterized protein involved in exopolysaccharide biosynthesis
MTEPTATRAYRETAVPAPMESRGARQPDRDVESVSALTLGSVVLRWRRLIIALGLGAGTIGLVMGLTSPRLYKSSATFIPQASESGISNLALAAGQLGIRIPTSGGGWSAGVYVELLRSRSLLETIASDTFSVAERGGGRVAMMDLLEIDAPTPARRMDQAVLELTDIVKADWDRQLGAVKLEVATPWPSVSLAIAEALLEEIARFNNETRKSQAAAERQFVEAQAADAERNLRSAEAALQSFRERNRVVESPRLQLEGERLSRDVSLHQQLYTSLLQSREDARIREVRDTPVITVLEEPRLPIRGESRGTVKMALFGGIAAGMIGVVIALLAYGAERARLSSGTDARDFFRLLDEATPRFLRRSRSR